MNKNIGRLRQLNCYFNKTADKITNLIYQPKRDKYHDQ